MIVVGVMMRKIFNVGDLVRYRDRIPTDPPKTGGNRDGWGILGVVIKVIRWNKKSNRLDALEIITPVGDNILVKMADVEILS